MKKVKYLMLMLAMVAGIATANAQDSGAGVFFNYANGKGNINIAGLGVKYDFMVSDNFRLEPSFTYYFPTEEFRMYDASVNAHYLFEAGDQGKFYPIFGVSTFFGNDREVKNDAGEVIQERDHFGRFSCNLGAGYQYSLTDDFALFGEVKYKLAATYGHVFASVGCLVSF